jgi:mannose-1-phosphate guanylyltransferase
MPNSDTHSQYEQQYNVKIDFSVETEPLGTAGPLKLAEKILGKDDSPFFVLNSDVICDYPFKQLADFHKAHGDEGTIIVTKVEEPSKYGVVVHKPNHASRIDRFVEKPIEFVGNRINAGIYILNPSVLKRIELRPTSIEQETFPSMTKDGQLHSFDLEGFWMDVGQPKDFLSGTCLYLSSLTKKGSKELTSTSESYVHGGNVLIDPSAKIGSNCKIGPNVVIGPNCVIGDGVRLQRCVLLSNSKVKEHAWIKSTIVGWNSVVGRWARLENICVLGDDVTVGDEIYVNGGRYAFVADSLSDIQQLTLFPVSFLTRPSRPTSTLPRLSCKDAHLLYQVQRSFGNMIFFMMRKEKKALLHTKTDTNLLYWDRRVCGCYPRLAFFYKLLFVSWVSSLF